MNLTATRKIHFILGAMIALSMSVQAGLLRSSAPGDTVTYKDISESISGTGTYGTPNVYGDSLDFNPLGLGVLANDASGGSDFNDAQLQFAVEAHNGYQIDKLKFSEAGDYFLSGLGNHAEVTATFFVNIYEVDGVALATPITDYSVHYFGNYTTPTDPSVGLWSGNIDLDIEALLLTSGVPFAQGATAVSVNLDNIMYAESTAGTFSRINKKDATGFTVTAVVPEPGTATLLGGGSLFLISFRRKFSGLRHRKRTRTCGYTRMIINHLLGRSIL